MNTRTLLCAALALALAGCVSPPLPLDADDDPACQALGAPLPSAPTWRPPRLAVAWPALSYLDRQEALLSSPLAPPDAEDPSDEAEPDAEGPSDEAEPAYGWGEPPLDRERLQAELCRLLEWALYAWVEPGARPPQTFPRPVIPLPVAPTPQADDADDEARRQARFDAVCRDADEQAAPLALQLELLENEVRWVGREPLRWITTFTLFWGGGLLPIVALPDEIYEAALRARVELRHTRTGRTLFARDYRAAYRDTLNEFQRGWTVADLFWLQPFFLEGDDYLGAYEALYPHAERQLFQQLLRDLRQELPQLLAEPEVREWLRAGDPTRARTHALVVGVDNPDPGAGRGLSHAEADASVFSSYLREDHQVATKHSSVLLGEDATPAAIESFLAEQGPRLLEHDTLVIYFAGLGAQDAEGAPELVLDGNQRYGLSRLEAACFRHLENNPRTTFVFDTSFAGPGNDQNTYSRTWATAEPGQSPLDALQRQDRWLVITASGPGEYAHDGGFTTELVRLLRAGSNPALTPTLVSQLYANLTAALRHRQTPRATPFEGHWDWVTERRQSP